MECLLELSQSFLRAFELPVEEIREAPYGLLHDSIGIMDSFAKWVRSPSTIYSRQAHKDKLPSRYRQFRFRQIRPTLSKLWLLLTCLLGSLSRVDHKLPWEGPCH